MAYDKIENSPDFSHKASPLGNYVIDGRVVIGQSFRICSRSEEINSGNTSADDVRLCSCISIHTHLSTSVFAIAVKTIIYILVMYTRILDDIAIHS